MKNLKHLFLAMLATSALMLSGCLHVLEEVTVKKDGSGSYKMVIDMSEMKSMMDMFKGMGDEEKTDEESTDENPVVEESAADNGMGEMGTQLSAVAASLKGISGIVNVVEINDTSSFNFGYSFDFTSVAALNKAMKIINKEKYDSKVEEVFQLNGKNFERLAAGDLGEEIKKAMSEEDSGEEEGSMEMVKSMFSDMTYKQIYHFPDRKVKKSSNTLSEISDDGHTLTITLKPFDEDQQQKKMSVGTKIKLK